MAEVELKGIYKAYQKNENIIEDLDLKIKDGEFLVLVGPSGCGKSTILRMIAGLEEVTQGSIFISENEVTTVEPKNRDIAMVFQNYALYPHMTVYENMAFALKLRKINKNDIYSQVYEAAEILELTELLKRKPKQLSGGQSQRVALGRAIVRKPKVFLFDEPLSNLDAKLRVQMRSGLKKLHQRLKTTMIYVTHDQTEAMTMGDRTVILDKGKIQQVDTPVQSYNKPENLFVAKFIGSPPMNILPVYLENNTFFIQDTDSAILETELKIPDGKYMLGIRPEDVLISSEGKISGIVDIIETLGNEIITQVKIKSGHQVTARVHADIILKENTTLSFSFDSRKVHIFDNATNKRITV